MSSVVDIDQLRSWIGREEVDDDVLTPSLAKRFHATLGLPGDPAAAGEKAPRLIHFCLCQPAASMSALGEDGHPARGGFLPPVPLPRRMWAGSTIEFSNDLVVGEAVTRRSTIADITFKAGRTGPLYFVAVDHVFESSGIVHVRDRQTIVYRGADTTPPSATGTTEAALSGAANVALTATPTLLFRYSALTFNGHRIHYDQPYATGVEGYPGLVVHGPLQATLLLHLATRQNGERPPDHFKFQSKSPLFHCDQIDLHAGTLIDGAMVLWTARSGGPCAMRAEARWDK